MPTFAVGLPPVRLGARIGCTSQAAVASRQESGSKVNKVKTASPSPTIGITLRSERPPVVTQD